MQQEGTHLGHGKQTLRDIDDILHLLNRPDALLDSFGVLRPRAIQNRLDLVNVSLSPLLVWLLHALHPSRTERIQQNSEAKPKRGTRVNVSV